MAFGEERDVRARFGTPIVDGDRAAVEWWAALVHEGREVTLAGTSVLHFDADGLVLEQRDTWNVRHGRSEPPAGWGAQERRSVVRRAPSTSERTTASIGTA